MLIMLGGCINGVLVRHCYASFMILNVELIHLYEIGEHYSVFEEWTVHLYRIINNIIGISTQ